MIAAKCLWEKLLLSFFFIGILIRSYDGFAQRKILVVPFDRFEFHTEIPLEMINEANGFELDQYYPALARTMTDAFTLGSSKESVFVVIGESDYNMLRRYLKFRFNGKEAHYECSLELLHKNIYQQILEEYNCQYMLVIDWYRIMQKKEGVTVNKIRKVDVYTEHYIDYDLFNKEKVRIHFDEQLRFKVEVTEENLKYHGVRLADLRPVFQRLVSRISQDIRSDN